LLRGHGVVTVGTDVPEATMRAVKLESLCQLMLDIDSTRRPPQLLSDHDVDETMSSWIPRARTFVGWTWEHYRRKLRTNGA